MNINEGIIEPIFQALLENSKQDSELKQELEILAITKSPFSLQKKGNKIVECFPWPIGKEFSTLFSSSYNVRDQKRILKIFRVAERVAQFISYCWVIQLWDIKREKSSLELSKDFYAQFDKIHRPTIGTYLGLIRSISNILSENDFQVFFKSSNLQQQTKRLVKEIEKLATFRNNELHFKEQIICEDAEDILAQIIVNSSFLVNYPMVSIRNINVSKNKLSNPKYVHSIDQLNSQRSEFSAASIELDDFSESYSVLLIESLHSMGTYLNLSPLIINTEPFLESRGRNKVLQGLYVYSEKSSQGIQYSFVNESEINSLDEMPNSEIFKKQWDNLFNVLSK